ncbi:MAG TPA: hypothetical protein VLI54_05160 [Bacillota bacterium]|nr:hypothetical protein [Bacillota bacterium]
MTAHAAGSDFNIQVAPSPLAISLTPGQQQSASLTVRNFSNHNEVLRPSLTGFRMDSHSQKISLTGRPPADMANWVSFEQQTLTLGPGAARNLDISFATPNDVGFSYSAAITLSRVGEGTQSGTTSLKGSVAIFCLININRADAKSALAIDSFKANKSSYEFLPASFDLSLKNNGNVIAQPTGTVFIQRSFSDNTPLATLPINSQGGYILPSTSRSFNADWKNGFPAYVANPAVPGKPATYHLEWNWSHLSQLRFGRYVAKAVIIYNDGHNDVPLIASYTFWVVPWRIIGFTVFILAIMITGLYAWGRLAFKGVKKVQHRHAHHR